MGRIALGGNHVLAGVGRTQVVQVFGLVAARTSLRDHEAAGYAPATVAAAADDRQNTPLSSSSSTG